MWLTFGLFFCLAGWAQTPPGQPAQKGAEAQQDGLGRTTPRGTVLGFLYAVRKGDTETAARYLNTRKTGKAAATLAQQLFVVLDRRLPARLNKLGDVPEGSLAFPANPDLDLVGTVVSAEGDVDILLDRVAHGKNEKIWLFSRKTLDAIPGLYDELQELEPDAVFPRYLVEKRFLGIALFNWLAVFIGLPLAYLASSVITRAGNKTAGSIRRHMRQKPDLPDPEYLPAPIRLFLLAVLIRWGLTKIELPLIARQVWTTIAALLAIAGSVWLVLQIDGRVEKYFQRRLEQKRLTGAVSVVRFVRRVADVLVLIVGLLIVLSRLGVNVGAAVAGLGVGGIAVALAAQKTLENVIGGVSLIIDQTVRIGDFVKVGDVQGTVEQMGLRSIRIRTNDRTVVSVPNGQVATASLENMSARDKFWFHHFLAIAHDSAGEQLRSVLSGLTDVLTAHASVVPASVRVSLLRFGASSIDVELNAYVFAVDMGHFFAIQQELLLKITEVVQKAGARIAIPAQALYLAGDSAKKASLSETPIPPPRKTPPPRKARRAQPA